MMSPDASGFHDCTAFWGRGRRLGALLGGLFVLLVLVGTAGSVSADTSPPRVYLPLIGRDFEPAWRWYAPSTPTVTPTPNHFALALDNSGQAHLLWDVTSYGLPRFIYHSFAGINTGAPWSQPAPVATSLGESSLLYAPVPGPDGALHLLWHNLIEPDHQERLLYTAFRGGAWSSPETVYQTDGAVTGMTRSDSTGRVTATVVDSSSGWTSEIFQVARLADGVWSAPQPIPRNHLYVTGVVWPDFADGVHLYEQESISTPLLYHSYWHDGGFTLRDQPVAVSVFGRSTQGDALGNLHIYWNDLTAIPGRNITALYHQCVENSAQPLTAEVPSGELAISDYVGAADTAGRFALAWRDEYGAVRLGIWRGCARQVIRSVPLPAGSNWQLRALALGATPDAACLLLARTGYPTQYAVVCGGTG